MIPRGLIFTQRASGIVGLAVQAGQRVWGRESVDEHCGVLSHFGGNGRPYGWEAHWRSGVAFQRIAGDMTLFRPPMAAALGSEDYERAFSALNALVGKDYDKLWIATNGLFESKRRFICSEVVGTYLRELMARNYAWPGHEQRVWLPGDVERWCPLLGGGEEIRREEVSRTS